MARQLRTSAAAAVDLDAAQEWLTQRGAGARALRKPEHIRDAILDLTAHPCHWRLGRHTGVRERPVDGYLIMYTVIPDTGNNRTADDIDIIRVFAPFQNRDRL